MSKASLGKRFTRKTISLKRQEISKTVFLVPNKYVAIKKKLFKQRKESWAPMKESAVRRIQFYEIRFWNCLRVRGAHKVILIL